MSEDWRKDLSDSFQKDAEWRQKKFDKEEQAKIDRVDGKIFLTSVVLPAFEQVKAEFLKYNKPVEITASIEKNGYVELDIKHSTEIKEYSYRISLDGRKPAVLIHSGNGYDKPIILSDVNRAPGTIDDITQDQVARHVITQYNYYKASQRK